MSGPVTFVTKPVGHTLSVIRIYSDLRRFSIPNNECMAANSAMINPQPYQEMLMKSSLPKTPQARSVARAIVSRNANVDGIKLHYLTAGKGPPLILLHGYAETSRMWRPIIPLLAQKIHGNRARPSRNRRFEHPSRWAGYEDRGRRIHALAKSLGVEKARVVGHDIGLMVAYAYAAQFPTEVEKLVVMDAFFPGVGGLGGRLQ